MNEDFTPGVRQRLRDVLRQAIRAHDPVAMAAIRTALATIENAEAVPESERVEPNAGHEHVAGTSLGVGAAEAPRRDLNEAQAIALVERDIREMEEEAKRLETSDHAARAARLRQEADTLRQVLEPDGDVGETRRRSAWVARRGHRAGRPAAGSPTSAR